MTIDANKIKVVLIVPSSYLSFSLIYFYISFMNVSEDMHAIIIIPINIDSRTLKIMQVT